MKKHLRIERAARLEELSGFLSGYIGPPEGEEHIITNYESVIPEMSRNEKFTFWLNELGELNKKRQYIIDQFLNYKPEKLSLNDIISSIDDGTMIIDAVECSDGIDTICKYFLSGLEIPIIGLYEDEKGFLHFLNGNIISLIYAANKEGEKSKLIKYRLLGRCINVVINSDKEYLKIFL